MLQLSVAMAKEVDLRTFVYNANLYYDIIVLSNHLRHELHVVYMYSTCSLHVAATVLVLYNT